MVELDGKDVLITGGCGSIGSQLTHRILEQDPRTIRIFDNNEQGLFELQQELRGYEESLRLLLGDIRSLQRLRLAVEDIDVVFHAGAVKHVELNEYNPFEAVQTNVLGTQNLIRAAIEEDIDSFIGVSTDKASNPVSVMGATKLLSERLIVAANTYTGSRDIAFSCVRFGNVAGTSGSVIPIFLNQIRDGGPIQVTDPTMTRFIMHPERAVDLILKAARQMDGGEVFILKMPSFQLSDLAEAVREEFAPLFGMKPDDIEIDIIGPRPGERMHEKLISGDELRFVKEREDMFVLLPQIDIPDYELSGEMVGTNLGGEFTSADARMLSKDEIKALVNDLKLGIVPTWGSHA